MDKKNYAYGLIILNLILQIASCFWYNKLPGFVWALAGAIVILVPLLYGWQIGLLCLLPLAASELVWFFKLGSFGPLLQLACYTIAFIIMAVAHPRIAKMPQQKRILLSWVLLYCSYRREGAAVSRPAVAGPAEISKLEHFIR